MKDSASWASSSSRCTAYGSRTAMNSASTPSLGEPLDGELAEPPGERRILAAADAEHEAGGAGRLQVVDEEADALLDLGGRVDRPG